MALKVGIQLYSVRDEMAKDPVEAIRKVAEIGYKNLEVANSRADEDPGVGFDVPADKLLEILGAVGQQGHPLAQVFRAQLLELAPDIDPHLGGVDGDIVAEGQPDGAMHLGSLPPPGKARRVVCCNRCFSTSIIVTTVRSGVNGCQNFSVRLIQPDQYAQFAGLEE